MPSVLVAAMVLLLLMLALGLILGFARLVRAEAEKVRVATGRTVPGQDG